MRALSVSWLALCLAAAGPVAAAAETIADCPEFKAGWSAALRRIEPARPELVYGPPARGPDGPERVVNLPDVEARLTCPAGKLSHIEVRQAAAGAAGAALEPFLNVSAAVLLAFDHDLGPGPAAELIATMRAEATAKRAAVSSWGPYEITYGRAADGGGDEFVVDLAEN